MRITEAENALTTSIDSSSTGEFVRMLRAVDAQLFAGFNGHEGLLDCAESLLHAAQAAKKVLDNGQ